MLRGFRQYPSGGGLGNIFAAKASATALAAYSSTAQNGLLLWNGSAVGGGKGVVAYLLSLSFGLTTASTVAGSIGIAVGSAQPAAPTSTTAIGISGNLNPAGSASACTPYSAGTVAQAATAYMPVGRVHTGAITVDTDDDNCVHLGGSIVIPPNCWAAISAGVALTTSVIDLGLTWLELPYQ
jgi:hypothetical protein